MRAGTGGRRPLSRKEVARRLDLSLRRVAAEERGAVRILRGADGSCSTGGAPPASDLRAAGLLDAAGVAVTDPGSAARGLGALLAGDLTRASTSLAARNEVAGARAGGSGQALSGPAGGTEAAGRTLRSPFGALEATSRDSLLVASLVAVVAALAALLLVREVRRRWLSG